jgi:hypothetical protein
MTLTLDALLCHPSSPAETKTEDSQEGMGWSIYIRLHYHERRCRILLGGENEKGKGNQGSTTHKNQSSHVKAKCNTIVSYVYCLNPFE